MSMMLSFVGDDLGFSRIGWEHHPLVGLASNGGHLSMVGKSWKIQDFANETSI